MPVIDGAHVGSQVIQPQRGEKFVVHVYSPLLRYNRENTAKYPTAVLRSSLDNYQAFRLYYQIDFDGRASLVPHYESPVPHTGGRAVCVLETASSIVVWKPGPGFEPPVISATEHNFEMELRRVMRLYRPALALAYPVSV